MSLSNMGKLSKRGGRAVRGGGQVRELRAGCCDGEGGGGDRVAVEEGGFHALGSSTFTYIDHRNIRYWGLKLLLPH